MSPSSLNRPSCGDIVVYIYGMCNQQMPAFTTKNHHQILDDEAPPQKDGEGSYCETILLLMLPLDGRRLQAN